uniref:Phosphotyrosine protein phosphatase I domain-containing protein n=1 Tax=Arcella intermedia TaxID=1963864 RepID=A0A6B2LK56_9EUKA|eukprot:TRINITY_DN25199_c0_g1_i1.p1 TRINITY_DN25199_c0_g1~~TRINITY_DN25199_c0_g1_i1.p1  ORF type:complete len:177 (+),score=14.05 TRINITY_DN25199_c0_g1_i1:89-619(+)
MKVVFVCLGNICRSPMAEGLFLSLLDGTQKGRYRVDSCGTGGGSATWFLPGGKVRNLGAPPDPRAVEYARSRGLDISGQRSRPLTREDLEGFDWIITMDKRIEEEIYKAAQYWGLEESTWKGKVLPIIQYCSKERRGELSEVPDPYYGGIEGFQLVYDILLDGCTQLLKQFENKQH